MTQRAPDENPIELPGEPGTGTPADQTRALLDDGEIHRAIDYAADLHPAELADVLESLSDEDRARMLSALDSDTIADALYYVEPHFRGELLRGLPADVISRSVEGLADDVATDVIQELPDEEADAVLGSIAPERRRAIERLRTHDKQTAGGRMTGQVVTVRPTFTVRQTIETVRHARPDVSQPFYIYVTDVRRHLLGVLNLRGLLADPDTPVTEMMESDLVTVRVDTDQEEAARLLKQYRLLALPVLDSRDHLVGTVTADDLLDVLEDEATEDMFRMVGVSAEEDLRGVWRSVRHRLPWLTVNLITVMLAAWVIALFEGTLERVAVLAAYLPVVAGMGGNAGIQTLTVVVRSLAIGRLTLQGTLETVRHELGAGIVMGLVTGLIVGVIAAVWQAKPVLGLVVGGALLVNVLVGMTFGVLIPMGLHRLRQDPALSGGIWLTTTTDVFGFLVYLGAAAALISWIQ